MDMIDLRSDTITWPDEGMRKAMYQAEVGDDVYSDDPTVNALQELGAELTGKDASIFVPSGSMGNLIALYQSCGRGSEVIAHELSHIFHYELSSMAAMAGLMPRPVPGNRGKVTVEEIEKHLRGEIYYMARTGLIEIENTHNLAGGTCYSKPELSAIADYASDKNIPIHMDGARVFNASEATGMSVKEISSYTDTITFCLSKGLGAPVGSLLCGSEDFIREARRTRKMMGGGMRQAGIIAAGGIYALRNNVSKLKKDHQHAKMIAGSLAETAYAGIDPESVETNIVYFSAIKGSGKVISGLLKRHGILISILGPDKMRIVTHLCIDSSQIEKTIEAIGQIDKEL